MHIIDGDISEQSEVERILDQSISLGKVDILVNCAGVFPQIPISELDTSEYQKLMNIIPNL